MTKTPIPIDSRIEILAGDLTDMDVDAIVNAANNDLQLGGDVAGAIRRKRGGQIQLECDEIGTIPVGTGIAGFPLRECAGIMLREALKSLAQPTPIEKIYFVLLDEEARRVFEAVQSEIKAGETKRVGSSAPKSGRQGRACLLS